MDWWKKCLVGMLYYLSLKTIIQCFNNTFKGFGVWDFFFVVVFHNKIFQDLLSAFCLWKFRGYLLC